jgi:polyisoprenoid-binding protein YceI
MAWTIDNAHSSIHFSARHMMISTVRGEFHTFRGTVNFNEETPELSTVDVEIETGSLETRDAQRDGHLKSPDFFDVEKYPIATFKSTRAEKTGEDTGKLYGNLTVKETTREIVLDVEYNGQSQSPWGMTAAGFTATTKINRKDWGLNWNVALETGGVLVGEEVKLTIEAEIVKQPEAQPEAEEVATA